MKTRLLIAAIIIPLFSVCVFADDAADKEMAAAWDSIAKAYNVTPPAQNVQENLSAFIDKYKDSYRLEASRAIYLNGVIYYKNRKYAEAYDEFKKLAEKYSESRYADSAMYKMGECMYNTGNYKAAIDVWDSFRFKYSQSLFVMEAVYGICLSYIQQKEFKKASKELADFLEKYDYYKKEEKLLLIGGIIDYYLGFYDTSVEKLKKVKTDAAYYYMGHSLLKIQKYLESANAFKKIGEDFKSSQYLESALYNKAEAFYKGENYKVAADAYREFLTKFPTSNLAVYAAFKRGSALLRDKKYELAVAAYKEASNNVGDKRIMAYAVYLTGECYRLMKDYPRAQAAYQKVASEYPDIYDAYGAALLKQGWCDIVLKNYDKAESSMKTFVQNFITHEQLPLGYYLLGNSYYVRKMYSEALFPYKSILDKFKYTDLTEAALLMTILTYYNQEQYSLLISDASQSLAMISQKFASPKSGLRARQYYYLGQAYYKLEMYGPAARTFQEIVDKYYDSDITAEARANLAWCLYQLENYKGARTMARDVIDDPKFTDANAKKQLELLVAHSLFCEKSFDKASTAYQTFAAKYQKDKDFDFVAEALFQQGKVLEIQEYYLDAISAWKQLASNYPKAKRAAEATYKMGDIYFKAQKFAEAIASFETVMQKWPDSEFAEDSMLAMAEVYYNSGDEAKAEATYERFLKKYPDSTKIKSVEEGKQRAMYRAAEKKNDPVKLLEFADKYPESTLTVDALYKAAEIYYTDNKPDKAVDVFSRVIREFPNDTLSVNAHYYIAACYEALQKTEEAVNAYKAFLKNYPKHELAADVTFRLATADYVAKNFTEAVFYYERVIEKYQGSEYEPNAVYNCALAYADLNKMDDAIRYYKMFAQRFPKDEKTKAIPSQIAGIYLEQKRYTEAIAAYNDIYKTGDDTAKQESLYRIGEIWAKQENNAEAIKTYSQLIDTKPKESDFRVVGLMNLATIYFEAQDWKNAVKIYRLVADSGGNKDYTAGAKGAVDQIVAAYPDLFKEPAKTEKNK